MTIMIDFRSGRWEDALSNIESVDALISDPPFSKRTHKSRPGDLVCDPCAGGATTLIAARMEGRQSVGAEQNNETFSKATSRIDRFLSD